MTAPDPTPAEPRDVLADNAGPWTHDDGTPCPFYYASKPTPPESLAAAWWCTEHQQHVHPTPAEPCWHTYPPANSDLTCPSCGKQRPPAVPDTGDVDALARVLMAAWEAAEGALVGVSYVATHADMARAVLASGWLAAHVARVRQDTAEQIAQAIEADGPPADYPGGTVAGRAYARAARIAREDVDRDE